MEYGTLSTATVLGNVQADGNRHCRQENRYNRAQTTNAISNMDMNSSVRELTVLRAKAERILTFCTFTHAKATAGLRIAMMVQQAEIPIVD